MDYLSQLLSWIGNNEAVLSGIAATIAKEDLAIPVKYGKDLAAQLPNARIVLLEGSNHWMIAADKDIDHIVGLIDDFVLNEASGRP